MSPMHKAKAAVWPMCGRCGTILPPKQFKDYQCPNAGRTLTADEQHNLDEQVAEAKRDGRVVLP